MNFRDALYGRYVTTHLAGRKKAIDQGVLRQQGRVFRQHFGRYLPRTKAARICDLGCGSGSLVWWLMRCGYDNVSGVDGSAEQVTLAHELGLTNVVEGDIFQFLSNRGEFDLLFARDVVEHFDRQGVFDFLGMCQKALSPDGMLVLQVPNAESPYFGRVRYGDFTHELAFTQSSLSQLFAATGFRDFAVRPWRPGVMNTVSALRHLLWRAFEPLLQLPAFLETGRSTIVTVNLIATGRKPL